MNTEVETEGWDIQPSEIEAPEGDEYTEAATIEELRGDVESLTTILRKIAHLDPGRIGNPDPQWNNKHYGKKIILALEKAKSMANDAHYQQEVRDYLRIQRFDTKPEEGTNESPS